MGTPFISEIRLFSFGFAPKGWLTCSGQLLPINQNQPLFSLIGTTYGGNGVNTFGLPDLRGRVAMSTGSGGGGSYTLGQFSGETQHTLTVAEMPQHNHVVNVNNAAAVSQTPTASSVLGVTNSTSGSLLLYNTGAAQAALAAQTVGNNGGNQPHQNMMPFLALSYCISLQGIFPSRN